MKRMFAAVMVALMVLTGCAGVKLNGDQLAVVNGRSVTQDELDVRRKLFEVYFRQPMDNPSSKQQLLDQVVREHLIMQQAETLGVNVADEQVEAEMAKFFGALDRQYKTRDEVNKKLQEAGLTNNDVAGFLKQFLATQQALDKKKAEVTVSDDEIRAFYEQNRESMYTFQSDVVRAAHVLVPLDQEQTARDVAAKAKAGGAFAELARLYSVDPGSGSAGGDLGYFPRERMVPEFADAAFSMEVGEISEPVRSQFGWHVIKLSDKQPAGTLSYELAKDDARNKLLPEKQETALQQWLTELEQSAKIEKTSFTEGAAAK